MSNRQARFERRLAERRAEQNPEAVGMPPLEKRSGEERRVRSMTPAEVDDWLKRSGISGGDRRKGSRRKR